MRTTEGEVVPHNDEYGVRDVRVAGSVIVPEQAVRGLPGPAGQPDRGAPGGVIVREQAIREYTAAMRTRYQRSNIPVRVERTSAYPAPGAPLFHQGQPMAGQRASLTASRQPELPHDASLSHRVGFGSSGAVSRTSLLMIWPVFLSAASDVGSRALREAHRGAPGARRAVGS